MIDKNSGEFHYAYNPFGELLWQTKKTTSTNNFREYFTYDQLGRIQKTELKDVSAIPTLIRETNYDYYLFGDGVSNVKQIKLNEYDSPSSYTTTQQIDYTYDRHGRVLKKVENIKGEEFNYQYSYNSKGQLSTETYPSYVKVKYEYTDKGYHNLLKRVDRNHNDELWQLISIDQFGSTTEYSLASGKIVTEKGYDDFKFPTTTLTKGAGNVIIQNLENVWNPDKGLLSSRNDLKNNQIEYFKYDDLFRLIQCDVENHRILPPVIKSDTMNYHIDGAMEYKSDIGAYRYKDVSGNLQNPVHGVKRIGNIYNKNITYQTNDLNTVYNSFRKIETIEGFVKPYYNCYNRAEFSYGYDESRTLVTFQSKATCNDPYIETHKKYYLSNYEYYIKANQDTKEVTYISTRNGVVAAIINETNQPERTVYVHKDYLGSIQSISEVNSQGQVFIVAEFSFDAWGRARSHTDWDQNFQSDASVPGFALLERGFTGHEHIIQFGIINMNARLYDPIIASFLSPDDVVSDPENPQNYNRFSYALNNPMRYTDPSGNNPFLIAMAIGAFMGGASYALTTPNFSWHGLLESATIGGISGAISAGVASLTGIEGIFGGIINSSISTAFINGCKYSLNGQDFFEGIKKENNYFSAMISGGISGALNSYLNEKNMWWGGNIAKNRSMWSLNNSPREDNLNSSNIPKLIVSGPCQISQIKDNYTFTGDKKGMCTFITLSFCSEQLYGVPILESDFTSYLNFRAVLPDGKIDEYIKGNYYGQEAFIKDYFGQKEEVINLELNDIERAWNNDQQVSLIYNLNDDNVHQIQIQEIHYYNDGSFNLLINDPNGQTIMTVQEWSSLQIRLGLILGK